MTQMYRGVMGRPTDREVKDILEVVKNAEWGAVIGYKALEKLAGCEHSENRFRTVISRAIRKARRELGMVLRVQPNVGYEKIHPKEVPSESMKGIKSGYRRVKRSGEMIAGVDRSLLTAPECKAADFVATRIVDIAQILRTECRMLPQIIANPTSTLPYPKLEVDSKTE